MFARMSHARPAWLIVLLIGAGSLPSTRIASAQSPPGTPIFEATGYGVVRPWFDMGRVVGTAKREPDAGAGAEYTTLPWYTTVKRVERWKVSAEGVPFFAGYVPTACQPTAATWADMNGDGAADLLCAEHGPEEAVVEIFTMGPDGPISPGQILTFDTSQWPAPRPVSYITVADVNGDGHPDVGVVSPSDWSAAIGPITWLVSQGPSSFATVRSFSFARPVVAQLGPDVSGDLLDWDPQSLGIGIAPGAGNGAFPYPNPRLDASGRPLVRDLDQDGVPDIVVGRFLYRGVAGGLPVKEDSLSANASALVDVDHDGLEDLVAVESGKVRVARGLGGFNFTPFTDVAAGSIDDRGYGWSLTPGPFEMSAVMDANGDGWTDVVGSAAPTLGRVLYAVPGRPGGRFHQLLRLSTGRAPAQIALADLLGSDGHLDLVVLARGSRRLELRAGAGDGTFGPAELFALPAGGRKFTLAHLNEDARIDVAVACDTASALRVFPGAITGLGAPIDLSAAGPLTDVAAADVDEDGHLDLVAATASGQLAAWRGDGGMGWLPAAWSSTGPASDGRLRLADVDGDGHLDLVTQTPWLPPWGGLFVQRGDGQGHFAADGVLQVGQLWPGNAFETGDLLADGRTFVAYVTMDSMQVNYSYFRAFTGQGGVKQPLPEHCDPNPPCTLEREGYEVAPTPRQVAIADVTGDGIPDLLVLSASGGTLTVIPGLGGGQFGSPVAHIAGVDPSSFALGDVDGDGDGDAMVADLATDEVVLMRHLGGATAGLGPAIMDGSLRISVESAPNAPQLRLRLALANAGAARVEFFDVLGRRLLKLPVVASAAGELSLTVEGGRLPKRGVLFARLTQGSAQATARLARFD